MSHNKPSQQQQQQQQGFFPEAMPPAAQHYHDAFGDGDAGVDYGDPLDFEEGDYDSVNGDANVAESAANSIEVGDASATNAFATGEENHAHTTDTSPAQQDTIDLSSSLDELQEEVGLHETTLSTLHQKLTSLISDIETEEASAVRLRNDLQLLNQRKLILKKKTEGNIELIKRVEGTLEKTLGRLRGIVGRQSDVEKEGDVGNDGTERRQEEKVEAAPDLMLEEIAPSVDDLHTEEESKIEQVNNNESKSAADLSTPKSKATYTEFSLHHDNIHDIQWPSSNSNESKINQFLPSWRTNVPTPTLWNINSAELLSQLMNVTSLENLLERQHLVKEGLLPDDAGWINENCIAGTCLDIYRQVDCRRWVHSLPTATSDGVKSVEEIQQQSVENELDPNAILCPYELGGKCADDRCPYQHLGRRPAPSVITLDDGRRFLRYYELPGVRLPAALGRDDFVKGELANDEKLTDNNNQSEKLSHAENETKVPSHRIYPCPTCAQVSLNAEELRNHMQGCNPSLLVVDGTEYNVQNILVDDADVANHKKSPPNNQESGLEQDVGDTTDFTNNHDVVCLPSLAEDSDTDSSDESICGEKRVPGKGFMFDDQFWWQALIPEPDEADSPSSEVIDLILNSFGLRPVRESGEDQIDMIRCSHITLDNGRPTELQEIVTNARIIDLCQICIHIGQESLGLSLLQSALRSKEHDYRPPILQHALDSMKTISCSRSACDIFSCQVHLMLISEFYKMRYAWLSDERPRSKEEPTADELLVFLNQDDNRSYTDHGIKRHLLSRIPSENSSDSWEDFVSCLQLQLEKLISVPFTYKMTKKEQLVLTLECARIGQNLQEVVESVNDKTFSALSHLLEPTWSVIQQMLKTSRRQLDSISHNDLSPQLMAILVVGPIIFACTSNIILRPLIHSSNSRKSLPDFDSRRRLDLSALEKSIVEVMKDIRRYGRNRSKCGNIECLLSPLYMISVATCVSLGSFDKAQLRLENAINSKSISRCQDSPPTNLISEVIWSQLAHLRMNCPPYTGIMDLTSINPANTVVQMHMEVASRILRYGIMPRGLDACGDRAMLAAAASNQEDQQEWQNLVSIVVKQFSPNRCASAPVDLEFAISHPEIEMDKGSPPDFPRSLLVAGQAMTHLSLVGCMLNRLPLSFGVHLNSLVSLNLSDNHILDLPSSFGLLKSLQTLDISHNKITSLPEYIRSCVELQFLDASYNQLSTFPGDLALHLPQLQSFVVEGNPAHDKAVDESNERKSKRRKIDTN